MATVVRIEDQLEIALSVRSLADFRAWALSADFPERGRIDSCPAGDVSAEPDIVLISHNSIDSGGVRLIPKAGSEPGRYIEIEGPADPIVEIVSDSSVTKDTVRLPAAYFRAGVRELWLADARRRPVLFRIHHRGPNGFEPTTPDADGYQPSPVLAAAYQLNTRPHPRGHQVFDVLQK